MRFQGLAVVLAKQKWSDLIASERKNHLGVDAHAPALLAGDATGRGLACSLTALLDKIDSEMQKIQQHAPEEPRGDVDRVLIIGVGLWR